MTGPDLNRPLPGSNAIGLFEFGVSPLGDIPLLDYWQTIISQYANSPILTQIIADFFAATDQTADMVAFFDKVWNIYTAEGWGLDVWGRIVGVNRTLDLQSAGRYFGFNEATTISVDPFNVSPFYAGQPLTTNFQLTDPAFLILILAKALANISDGSIPSINQLLINLFPGRGNAYVTDDGGMAMTYTFDFALTPVEAAIVTQSDVLPKPTGVAVTYVQNG